MAEAYIELLKAFGFKEMQIWIATVSAFLFACCLLGGILSGLAFVNSSQLKPRPLSERISFRLFIIAELILWTFVFFYHVFMIEMITAAHVIYWISASLMMPLLSVIGSQGIQVTFSAKMKAKADELKRRNKAQREKRHHEMEVKHDALPKKVKHPHGKPVHKRPMPHKP